MAAAHEYIPDARDGEVARWLRGRSAHAFDPQPAAADGAAPADAAIPEGGAAVAARRSPRFTPDRNTSLQRGVSYFAAFTPTVAPFKRLVALDGVELGPDGRTGVLAIAQPQRERVATEQVRGRAAQHRDRFWGEASLDFSRTRILRLSTVASDVRLLALRAEPAVDLVVERDGAHNYYVVLQGEPPVGRVHVRYQLDAPRTYFGGEIPAGLAVGVLADRVRPLPPPVLRSAQQALRELGLDRRSDLREALHKLVSHFRGFVESDQPPSDSGDILLDLVRTRHGVCRHRAYAFVIMAHALGIPARMVQNEAHSFVEVELPQRGYLRIDLGGAPAGLTAYGVEGRMPYQPWQSDGLPRPATYHSGGRAGRDTSTALRDPAALIGHWLPLPAEFAQASKRRQRRRDTTPADGRVPLRLRLAERPERVVRGARLQLAGRVSATGQGVPGLRVEVSLLDPGRPARLLLGFAESEAGGGFIVDALVPPDLPPGDYRLLLSTPGDDAHQPSWLH